MSGIIVSAILSSRIMKSNPTISSYISGRTTASKKVAPESMFASTYRLKPFYEISMAIFISSHVSVGRSNVKFVQSSSARITDRMDNIRGVENALHLLWPAKEQFRTSYTCGHT